MPRFRDIPIRHKLTILAMLTSGSVLLLTSITWIVYDQWFSRQTMARDLSVIAQMSGLDSSAALSFNDAASAGQTLRSLSTEPHIVAACIYDRNNGVFAVFQRAPSEHFSWPAPRPDGEYFAGRTLNVFHSIRLADETIGTIYIQSDLGELWRRLVLHIASGIAITFLAAGVAYLIVFRLQRVISAPILELAQAVGRVKDQKDYAVRATKTGNDELGHLIDGFNDMLDQIQARDLALQKAQTGLEQRVADRTDQLKQEISEREGLHQQLLLVSRQAGMAEVATGVLHNVGNVLNSINVSTTLLAEQSRHSKVDSLPKLVALLNEHSADLPAFLTQDPKGKKIPDYLGLLAESLATEQKVTLEELALLQKNIDHVKEIVSMQQNYAVVSGVAETVAVTEVIEDALRLNTSALTRHAVEVVREFTVQPTIEVEKHKVLQILVNLVRNAKYACDDAKRPDKEMRIRITTPPGLVRIAVIDNGIGIPPENLTRIFAHGFTTRVGGHGFGLHSGALTAKALGGSLKAESPGVGLGATFTLELPLHPLSSDG